MDRLVLIAVMAVAGCYKPQLSDCSDTCGETGLCPDGLSCVAGFCREPGAAGSCEDTTSDAGMIDAATGSIDAAPLTCPPVPMGQGCTTAVAVDPVAPNCWVVCDARDGMFAKSFVAGMWHAAVITSPQEMASAMAVVGGQTVWAGLQQAASQATPNAGWSWVTGATLGMVPWSAGQPDDLNGSENAEEQCGSLAGGMWSDAACATNLPFLIEHGP
ncbi:MAG: C-type lectin domain-containing protein [Kofleriaceae bacterium]